MGALRPEHVPFVLNLPLASASADADPVAGAMSYLHRKAKITSMAIIDGAGIAADNSNYILAKLQVGSSVVGQYDSRDAGQGALAANVGKEGVITDANSEIPAGSTLKAVYDETGTVGMTSAVMVVSGYWIQTA